MTYPYPKLIIIYFNYLFQYQSIIHDFWKLHSKYIFICIIDITISKLIRVRNCYDRVDKVKCILLLWLGGVQKETPSIVQTRCTFTRNFFVHLIYATKFWGWGHLHSIYFHYVFFIVCMLEVKSILNNVNRLKKC